MQVTYQLSIRDFLWFNLYQTPRTRSGQVMLGFFLLLFGYFAFDISRAAEWSLERKVGTFILQILLFLFLLFIVLTAYYTSQRKLLRGRLVASEEGLDIESSLLRSELKWTSIEDIRQTGNLIIIYLSDIHAHVVPKRAFASSKEAEQFFVYIRGLWKRTTIDQRESLAISREDRDREAAPDTKTGETRISCQNNFRDFLWSNLSQTSRTRSSRILLGFILLMSGYIAFLIARDMQISEAGKVFGFIIALSVLFFGQLILWIVLSILGLVLVYLTSSAFRKWRTRWHLTASEKGLEIVFPFGRSDVQWGGVTNIRRSGNLILIYITEESAIIVPGRAFASSNDAGEFFGYIRDLWQKNRHQQEKTLPPNA